MRSACAKSFFARSTIAETRERLRHLARGVLVDHGAHRELFEHRARLGGAAGLVKRLRPIDAVLRGRRVDLRETLAHAQRELGARRVVEHADQPHQPDLARIVASEDARERFLGLLRLVEFARQQHGAGGDRSGAVRPKRAQLGGERRFDAEPLRLRLRKIEVAAEQRRLLARDLPQPPQLALRRRRAVRRREQLDGLAVKRKAHARVGRARDRRLDDAAREPVLTRVPPARWRCSGST